MLVQIDSNIEHKIICEELINNISETHIMLKTFLTQVVLSCFDAFIHKYTLTFIFFFSTGNSEL